MKKSKMMIVLLSLTASLSVSFAGVPKLVCEDPFNHDSGWRVDFIAHSPSDLFVILREKGLEGPDLIDVMDCDKLKADENYRDAAQPAYRCNSEANTKTTKAKYSVILTHGDITGTRFATLYTEAPSGLEKIGEYSCVKK